MTTNDHRVSDTRGTASAGRSYMKLIGAADASWPDWYAACMVAEQAGTELPI
jgi:hypothetical protein